MTFLRMAKVLGRVLKYLVPYWKTVVLAITLTLLATGTRLCQAKFVGWIMELMSNNSFAAVEIVDDRRAAQPLPALKPETDRKGGEAFSPAGGNEAQSGESAADRGGMTAQSRTEHKEALEQDAIFRRYFSYENGQSPFMALNYVCIFFLLVMAVMGICTYFQKYLTDQCGQLAIRDFRNNVFFALQRLPISFFDKMRSGEVLSRSTTDVITASGVFSLLSEFAKNFLIVAGCFAWMFWRDWQMTLVVLFISPLIAIAIGNFGSRIGAKTSKLQARLADLSALQFENVSAIRVVKANGKEDYESRRFKDRNEDNYDAQMKVVQVQSMQSPVVELMGIVAIAIVVWFGATRIMQGEVSFSQMTEYWTLMAMTGHPLQVIASFYGSCQNSAAAAVRAFEVIDSTPETDGCGTQVLPPIKGGIEFKDVHFAYDKEKPVLKGISIRIEPGEFVAVVGMNGSGKSTLVNMLERFYSPDSGQILIDGCDIADVTLESLRSQIGIVFQESVLFRDSIYENVRYGNMEATDEQIRQAITMAGADEFIAKFPDGLETNVGERGSALSGGQRQRLAVARALVHDPRILILDEYTSGLDAEAEDNLTEVIDKSMKGRTCLVIAHRLATIRYADRIIVMDGGQVAEEGTHDELIAKNGIYRKIYEAQR